MSDGLPPADGAYPPIGADPGALLLAAVATADPAADLVVLPMPGPSGRPAPTAEEAAVSEGRGMAVARRALAAATPDVAGVALDLADVRTEWRVTEETDVVAAEAAVRLHHAAPAETIATRLRSHGWNVEIRSLAGGNTRVVGSGRVDGTPVGLDIGLWRTEDVVTVRTLVPDVHVGDERARRLTEGGGR